METFGKSDRCWGLVMERVPEVGGLVAEKVTFWGACGGKSDGWRACGRKSDRLPGLWRSDRGWGLLERVTDVGGLWRKE
jgi:hypothetical protein